MHIMMWKEIGHIGDHSSSRQNFQVRLELRGLSSSLPTKKNAAVFVQGAKKGAHF